MEENNSNNNLVETVMTFTNSNILDLETEVRRYKEITDYFAKKSNRDRYNSTNSKYLLQMSKILLELRGREMPSDLSDICSKLIKRFENGII